MTRLRLELGNLRAAVAWAADHDVQSALELVGTPVLFWYNRGFPGEDRALIDEVLARPGAEARTRGRAWALVAAAATANQQSDHAAAERLGAEAVAIAREVGDDVGHVQAAWVLGHALIRRGKVEPARAECEEALELALKAGAGFWTGRLRHLVAQACYFGRDFATAEAQLCAAVETAPSAGDYDWLGHVAVARGDHEAAHERYRRALKLRVAYGQPLGFAFTFCGMAMLAAAEGDLDRAARLAGIGAGVAERVGVRPERTHEAWFGQRLVEVRARLGEDAFRAAWEAGRTMPLERALAYARGDRLAGPIPAAERRLSEREEEVAQLVTQGLTNREIAARLVISQRTVDRHVANILDKLGFGHRSQIAAWHTERAGRMGISADARAGRRP